MRSHPHTGIHDADQLFAGRKQFVERLPLQGVLLHPHMSISHADPAPLDESADQDSKLRPYSPSERKIRAAAFAARVHSLKYYIGLIVAKSII